MTKVSREELLEVMLDQAVSTIDFLHGCLTQPHVEGVPGGYSYGYPEQTEKRLSEFSDALPPRGFCFHSRIDLTCEGCRRGMRHREVMAAWKDGEVESITALAERLVDAEIADEVALGELLDAQDDSENERCRDAQKITARERDDALVALAAAFGKKWPVEEAPAPVAPKPGPRHWFGCICEKRQNSSPGDPHSNACLDYNRHMSEKWDTQNHQCSGSGYAHPPHGECMGYSTDRT